jgi:hypothetical protein
MVRMALRLGSKVGLLLLAGLAASSVAIGIEVGIGRQAIERAIAVGRRPEAERARFHRRYVVTTGDPVVDRVEVISEFRRVVLAAEERIRFGDYFFGVREAEGALKSWRNRVSIVAELRFHPQNVYATVPPVEVVLLDSKSERTFAPLDIRRVPSYSLPPSTATGASSPGAGAGSQATALLGAVVEGVFEATPLARATLVVAIRLPPNELARAPVDLAALE